MGNSLKNGSHLWIWITAMHHLTQCHL